MALIMHSELNKNVCKTLIAAEYVGVEIKMAENFQMGESNKTPEFLKMNPLGKVPALETPEGPIFESNAIARYVARLKPENTLFGSSPIEYGQIEQWIDFSALELDVNMRAWVFPRLGYATYIKSAEESYISGVKRGLGALNTHLQSRTFLVGYAVTLADIIMTCNLVNGFKYLFTKSFTSEFPHVERYFWTMVNQPKFSKIIKLMGEIKQAEVVLPFPSSSTKPKPEPNPKSKPESEAVTLADIIMTCNLVNGFKFLFTKIFTSEFPHVERYFWTMVNQPKFSKIIKLMGQIKQAEVVLPFPSSSTKPKPEPNPKSKPESEAVDDVEEAAKPKATNPLDLLPPSKMVLDDWKRLYSNTKTNFREIAIKGFWEMFDPEGYSLWFCDYKFNDENTESFVIMNKVGGFRQRMDLARKYAFGKILIIGNEPPFKAKGLWIFRGPDIPKFVMDECYDIVFYEWTKVDLADEAQKERVNQMIEDMEAFEGEALLDAKCFK